MNPTSEIPTFGARIGAELDILLQLSPLALLIWLALVLGIAWLLAAGGPAGIRTLWRIGFDPRRRLGLLASGLRVVGLLVGVTGALRPLFVRAPTVGLISIVVLIALAGIVMPNQMRNLASGLSLATRSRMREGDLIEVGELEGTIRDIALLRVSVRGVDGGLTHVPAADFARLPVTVGSRRAAVPIEAEAQIGADLQDADLQRLRRALWLSPYRRANTEPELIYDSESGRVHARIDTWAALAGDKVRQHLRKTITEFRAGLDEEDA